MTLFYTERVGCTYRLVRMPVGGGSGGPPNAERSWPRVHGTEEQESPQGTRPGYSPGPGLPLPLPHQEAVDSGKGSAVLAEP